MDLKRRILFLPYEIPMRAKSPSIFNLHRGARMLWEMQGEDTGGVPGCQDRFETVLRSN